MMSNRFLIVFRLETMPFPDCCPSDVHHKKRIETPKSDQEQQCTCLHAQKKLIIYHCGKELDLPERDSKGKTGNSYDPGNPKPIMREVLEMKKVYETPKAVKYVFDYQENVVASSTLNAKDGRNPAHPSYNACFTHNVSDNSTHNPNPCEGDPKFG